MKERKKDKKILKMWEKKNERTSENEGQTLKRERRENILMRIEFNNLYKEIMK